MIAQAKWIAEPETADKAWGDDSRAGLPQCAKPLRICLLGYRSAPYGGGQGIYIKYLSKALMQAGHSVDVISGEPYPHLDPGVNLIKLPGMNLYERGLLSLRPHHLGAWANWREWFGKLTGNFTEPLCFGRRVDRFLKNNGHRYDLVHDNQCLAYGLLNIQRAHAAGDHDSPSDHQ